MNTKNLDLYYNPFSGISGDMNLAAMIDLGVPEDHLRSELKKLRLSGYELRVTRDSRNGIFGTRVDIDIEDSKHHRHLNEINIIIDSSALSENVKLISKKIFLKLGEAEAKIHEKPIEKVHFHEVGAVDSIIDIVGAAICIDYLKPKSIYAGTIELGSGSVPSSHGILPVPAPATAEILKDIPTHLGGTDFEATTPTGAAILATVTDAYSDEIPMKIDKIGYGIGHKKTEKPNLLRVFMGKFQTYKGLKKQKCWQIDCNIDDMNPEWYELIMEKLFLAGAQDVFLTNIIMKKSRPGIKISVLCMEKHLNKLKEIMLTETTSLGLRVFTLEKSFLERKSSTIQTTFGEVRIKTSYLNGEIIHQKPEYEDCKRIALEKGITMDKIMKEIDKHL